MACYYILAVYFQTHFWKKYIMHSFSSSSVSIAEQTNDIPLKCKVIHIQIHVGTARSAAICCGRPLCPIASGVAAAVCSSRIAQLNLQDRRSTHSILTKFGTATKPSKVNSWLLLIQLHVKMPGGVDVQLHAFLTAAPEWSTSRPAAIHPGTHPGTHCIRWWVGTNYILDAGKRKISCLCWEQKPHFLGRPARGHSLYRLRYETTGCGIKNSPILIYYLPQSGSSLCRS
jgi:hypothetical protein